MQADLLEANIMQYIRTHSGFETRRDYLGMSHLSDCPRKLYNDFVNGQIADDRIHMGAFAGYSIEAIEWKLLLEAGIIKGDLNREIVADFDPLLRGHIDSETIDGDLLEIKSVNTRKFQMVLTDGHPIKEHIEQVQTYMHFGEYKRALIVYVCRETFQHKVFTIEYRREFVARLVNKARLVLKSIRTHEPPSCECGRCVNSDRRIP